MKVIIHFLALTVVALFIFACNKHERVTPLHNCSYHASSIIRIAAKVAEHQARSGMIIYNLENSQLLIIKKSDASYSDGMLTKKKDTVSESSVLSNIYPLDTMILLWHNDLQKK